MEFKGHQKTSFIDYPDKLSTVFFTGGCNFRCPYCHNRDLVYNIGNMITEEEVFRFLEKRKGYIDALCISGGEATIYNEELFEFIKRVKEKGYLVKLDSNGTNPNLIKKLIDYSYIDYIAMDIKGPFNKYEAIANSKVKLEDVLKSINILMDSAIDYEFRTTVCKELLNTDDIYNIAEQIKGAKKYVIQNFRDGDMILEGRNLFKPFDKEELSIVKEMIEGLFDQFIIR